MMIFCATVCVQNLWANDVNNPIPREKQVDILHTDVLLQQEQPSTPAQSTINLGTGQDAEINHALLRKDWQKLEQLLANYRQQADFDEVLHDYALGALYRAQKKHSQAIQIYQKLLNNNPEFHYIRFDMGVMAFENKQYRDAQQHIQQAKPHLNPSLQGLAEQYLAEIQRRQQFKPSFHFNFEKNDNVNNASSSREIVWQGKTWKKSADSLPQKATGVRYGVDVGRDVNISGNHFFKSHIGLDGVHYWDNSSYDEQRLNLQLGYKYQDIHHHFSILPFLEYSWFDDDLYTKEQGILFAGQRSLNHHIRLNTSLTYTDKNYQQERLAQRYDSHQTSANMMLYQTLKPHLMLFYGIDASRENAKNDEYSYRRMGGNLGVVMEHSSGLGGRVSLRYAQRQFEQPERLVYGFKRKDNEYYLQTMLWHNKIHYKKFIPQLNIRYHHIDSNMDGFYSRKGLQYFISVEKRF